MQYLTFLLFLFFHLIQTSFIQANGYSIVFIHIGEQLPSHLETAICQARLFNEQCQILLVANQQVLANLPEKIQQKNVVTVPCESLNITPEHVAFRKVGRPKGFWVYTSERFLYLYDLMAQYQLENVFHLENDNMLYVNLEELLPIFQTAYPGIAATFDNDTRAVAGFIYISNPQIMQSLASFFAAKRKRGNDMEILALYKNRKGSTIQEIDHLPIIPTSYAEDHVLKNRQGKSVKNPEKFHNHIDQFQSLFDAAAIGQYLGGGDIYYHPQLKPGFINESCIFNPSFFTFEWKDDCQGRSVPYAIYNHQPYRINNIHVHSKQLHLFASIKDTNE